METIEIVMPDGGVAEAYVARPSAERLAAPERRGHGDLPGVLFFMDAIGLRPRIAEMSQQIADWGYVVLAPNLFFREGRAADLAPQRDLTEPGAREEFFALASPRVQRLGAEQAERDIPAYLKALRGLDGVAGGAAGTTGYCMGARLAMRTANLDPGVAAVGGFHGGGLVTDTDDSPHLGLGSARAEFVFGHADQDRSMPPEAVAALGAALTSAGLVASNEIYSGAAHGYTMSDTAMYDEGATERHFAELEALFARRLGPLDGA
ncbi:putative hydrolase [Janibacter sp. HTCC2649]|uniref:dienelactone hydrolase family protein n=1 Tax=Janibacter sp. HTCC2649 TaxID=313589 RepID=UPI0000671A7E|nr:dienelactone hydrolase family protein [Janibacter sp. HTCC2649]EAP97788.1 putative hydrolase [Janibacter sp. HTCC2649]